jgi:PKD repeat protein
VDLGAYERINTVSAHAGGPYSGNEGDSFALVGSGSSDEAAIASYAWDCTNNGSVEATSANPTGNSCSYPDDGTFTLKLTATDVVGLAGSATAAVTIANVLPTLTDPPNQSTTAGTSKNFTMGSFTDPGADAPWEVVIDWGDDGPISQISAASAGALPTTPHAYAAAGTYNVALTISDDHGSDSGGFQVVVNAAPPGSPAVTAAAAQRANVGEALSFALGTFSDAGDAGPWQITVNWGDGSAETIFNSTTAGALSNQPHTYAAAGTYNVLVTVSDGDLAASASFQVTIEDDAVVEDGGLYLPNITR